jgi:type 1 fimbriae regulatory protein FimB/type 1 fimbriae regulatory protein FimE
MRGSNHRRYFTESELNKLISAARKVRYGHRDATLILIMARHGLRVSEAVDLEWSQIDFTRAHLHVRR